MPLLRIACTVFLAASAPARGITPPPPPAAVSTEESMRSMPRDVVIVSGTHSVSSIPDLVSFNIGVETRGPQLRAAVDENNARVAKILTALKERGVKPHELKTDHFQLRRDDDGDDEDGYVVSNSIGVTRGDVAGAGELIALAIDAGANEVNGPELRVRDEKALQERCLELAFNDARAKARQLARLAERRLGKVLAVTDGSSSPFEFRYRTPGVEGGVAGGSVALEAGVHTVECGITAAFQLD
jgi:uncharacterized protein